MMKKLFAQSAGWVTRLKNRYTNDPFFGAQLKLIVLFFLVGSIISVVVNDVADRFLQESVYTISNFDTGEAVRLAFNEAERSLWFWRAVKLILTVIAAYFLVTFAFRPVKKTAELQKRFAAVASHELRTPLAIIKNSIEVALRNKNNLTLEKAVQILESNKEEVQRLANITEFLTVYSKLKEIKGPFPRQPIDLRTVVEKSILFLEKYGDYPRKIGLEITGRAVVNGDATSLKLMLVNLLKNSAKHTPPDGKIDIKISENENKVFLSVSDTGTGISKEDVPYIFEPFFSGTDKNYNLEQGSLGLGLSIVREIVRLHDGIIILEKTGKTGTTFKIIFSKV